MTVSVGDGTAASPADYAAVANFDIVIPANAVGHTGTFTLTPADDALDEPDETVNVTGVLSGATVTPDTVTITDNDAAPVLSIDSPSVAEGDNTTVTLTFTVSLAPASGKTVTVGYADRLTGTATSGTDYTALTAGTLTFAPGETSKTIAVTVAGDTVDEPNETVALRLSSAANATLTGGGATLDATGTIEDNDTATLLIADATAAEGATAVFAVTLSNPSATAVTVTATTSTESGDTATAGADYTHKTQELTIDAGDTEAEFEVTVLADTVNEFDETFTVTLSDASVTVTDDTAAGTIAGADTLIGIGDASAAEGGSLTFALTRSGDTTGTSSVQWTTGDDTAEGAEKATADADYTAVSTARTVSFAIGATTATIAVASLEDILDEPDETFRVRLASPAGAALANAHATGTITDDDAAPTAITLTVDADAGADNVQSSLAEDGGAKTVRVTATVTGATRFGAAKDVTVAVGKTGDSAAEGTDYDDVADQTITIAAGQERGFVDFALTPKQDMLAEPDETVSIEGELTGVTFTNASLTLTDDEAAPTALLVLTPASIDESGADNESTVTATLSGPSSQAVTLTVAAAPVSPAVAADFTLAGATLTIAAGALTSTGTVTVTAVDNDVDAPDKTVTVSATATGGNSVANPANRTLTVEDDDERGVAVSAAVGGVTLAEADDPATTGSREDQATYTVTLDSEPTGTVTVNIESEDTDIATVAPAALTFDEDDWSTARTVTVTAVADDADNANDRRTVDIAHTVSASGTDYATETADPVTVTVTDDDAAPGGVTLTVDTNGAAAGTPDTVAEGAGATAVTVSATVNGSTRYGEARTVTVSVGDGTAASPADYAAVANFDIVIPANAVGHTGTFTLTPADDALDEPDETVNVTGVLSGATVTPDTVTITDNDATPTLIPGAGPGLDRRERRRQREQRHRHPVRPLQPGGDADGGGRAPSFPAVTADFTLAGADPDHSPREP